MKFHLYSKHHLPLLKSKLLPHLPHKAEYSKSTDRQRSLRQLFAGRLFFSESYSILTSQIRKIIENEAPVSKSLLCKKILSEWGISRLGARVESQIETALDALNIYRTEHEGFVLLENREQCISYSIYRPVSEREATDIAPEEIANAIRQLLTDSISLPVADLIKACAQQFGFARMGSNIDAAMQRGIREAVKRNYAKIENERVTIAD